MPLPFTPLGRILRFGGGGKAAAPVTLYGDMMAFWPGDEASGNMLDAHTNALHLTQHGNPTNTTGIVYPTARTLVKTGPQYFDHAHNTLLQAGTGGFMVACWINNPETAANILSKSIAEYQLYISGSVPRFSITKNGGGVVTVISTSAYAVGSNAFVVAWYDPTAGKIYIQVNNQIPDSADCSTYIANATNAFDVGNNINFGPGSGLLSPVMLWQKVLTNEDRTWLFHEGVGRQYSALANVSYSAPVSFTRTATGSLQDNYYSTDNTNFLYSNTYARWKFTTTAKWADITVYCNIGNNRKIALYSNGVYVTTLSCPGVSSGNFTLRGYFPNGNPEIWSGYQETNQSTGTFLKSIIFFDSGTFTVAEVAPINPAARIYVYGDSIACGFAATLPITDAWTTLLRQDMPVILDAYGARKLYNDIPDAAHETSFAALIASATPSIVWLAIGANGISGYGSDATYGTAYGNLLDKIHADLPSAAIYAQTPILKGTDNLSGLRDAMVTALSTRSAWATLVDGTAAAFPQPTDLVDGLHPTTAGQAMHYAAVKTVLGL